MDKDIMQCRGELAWLIHAISNCDENSLEYFKRIHDLDIWIQANVQNELEFRENAVPEFIREQVERFKKNRPFSDAIADESVERITGELRRKKPFTRLAAAAVVLFITGGLLLTVYIRSGQQTKGIANKVMAPAMNPGAGKAMLTLSDGSIIDLDASDNGVIAEQEAGLKVRKVKEGVLVYAAMDAGQEGYFKLDSAINTITVPRGRQYQVVLADGTKVSLNAESTLAFPVAFTGNRRNVKLSGEGYFEVAASRSKPFFVRSGAVRVKVLGTSFNMNAYDSLITTTLVTGSVQVSGKPEPAPGAGGELMGSIGRDEGVILKPGTQAIVNLKSEIKVTDADTTNETAWKNGDFSFNHTDLKTILSQIGRWYNMEIVYKGPASSDTFTGMISRKKKLQEVLNVLQSQGIDYSVEGNKLIIH